MLRRAILPAIAAIALAGPALAADPLVYSPAPAGHPFYGPAPMIVADISFGGGFGSSDTKFAAGGARAVIDFGNSWNAMVEIEGQSNNGFGGYGHFFKREPAFAFGAYAGVNNLQTNGAVTLGVEGAYVGHPNLIVGGQLAWNKAVSSSNDFGSARAFGAFYFLPTTKVTADIGWFGGAGDMTHGSLGISHQFDNTPYVIDGRIGYATSGGSTNTYVMVGGTLLIGPPGESLYQHDLRMPFNINPMVKF
jgi:hypothetical protein